LFSSLQPARAAPHAAGIYDPAFIAANQEARADNLIKGSRQQQLDAVRGHIREFKESSGVDKARSGRGPGGSSAGLMMRCRGPVATGSVQRSSVQAWSTTGIVEFLYACL
jgi:hypothetical protein